MESSFPNLLCDESESSLKENKDENHGFCSVSESDCEIIEMLFECESSFQHNNALSKERGCFESVRSDVIKWFLQKMALFGYHYRTAYLSLIYFDRFLTRMKISDGKLLKIQILSIACLSLAAKMEECKVRPLRDYTIEGYYFLESSIKRMELIVLNTLEWRMCSVTPFCFLHYFAAKFYGACRDKQVLIRANKLILAIMREIDVVKHRPSIIAAAAVLAAFDNHLTRAALGSKMDAVPSWGSVEKVDRNVQSLAIAYCKKFLSWRGQNWLFHWILRWLMIQESYLEVLEEDLDLTMEMKMARRRRLQDNARNEL